MSNIFCDMAISQQLDDFAASIEDASAWTIQMNVDLYNLIAPLSLAMQGRDLPPPSQANCFDTLLPWRPLGWTRTSMMEIAKPLGGGGECTLSLWIDGGLKFESFPTKKCATITLAVIAATARAWSHLCKQAGN